MPKAKNIRSVLYVGQCYYNHWYLSRELRKLGWKADQLNLESKGENSNYYHGEDVSFSQLSYQQTSKKLEYYLYALASYQYFHFANKDGIYFINDVDHKVNKGSHPIKKGLLKLFFSVVVKERVGALFRLFYLIGPKTSTKLLCYFSNALPERWDIFLLKYFDKKIIYTNNSCHDGVTKKFFKTWNTPDNVPICDMCPLSENDQCNDEQNNKWGKFRNEVADHQFLLGSNRAEYNLNANIHENPWAYCLDKNIWSPDLLIPANYLLHIPKETVKIYHAVGNFDSRINNLKSIKSTHIYIPLINKLKAQGLNIELTFFKDVPNKEVRYYQAQADIFVDMLSYGFFGANIREGMMLGKPCICYLRPEWLEDMKKEMPEYVDELPIINANESNIEEILKDLVLNKTKRKEIGRRSRVFAEKWHSSDIAALKIGAIYESLKKR